jgi:hypothetical protein
MNRRMIGEDWSVGNFAEDIQLKVGAPAVKGLHERERQYGISQRAQADNKEIRNALEFFVDSFDSVSSV